MKAVPLPLAEKLFDQSEAVFAGTLARLEDVAVAVNVSRATLYYYFGGQDDLRAFLITEHVRGGSAAIASAAAEPRSSALERLQAVLAAMTSYLGERPGFCAAILGSLGSAGSNAELAAALQLNHSEIAEPIRRLLGDAAIEGAIAVDDLAAAADTILGGVLFAVLGRARRAPVDSAFARQVSEQLVRGITEQG